MTRLTTRSRRAAGAFRIVRRFVPAVAGPRTPATKCPNCDLSPGYRRVTASFGNSRHEICIQCGYDYSIDHTKINANEACNTYYNAIEGLSATDREHAEFSRGQAMAYMWGAMDNGLKINDPNMWDAFSWAYGTMNANFQAGRIGVSRPLRDSWESFTSHGEIRDYNGKRLDFFDLPD